MVNQIKSGMHSLSSSLAVFVPWTFNEVTASFSFFMHQNVVLKICALTLFPVRVAG